MQLEPLVLTPDEVADGESWEDVVVVETSLAGVDARALGFSDSEFEATDLSAAKLPNLFLAGCRLRRANLANTLVRNGSMRRVGVDGSRLTGFAWTGGDIRDASFRDCRADMASFESSRFAHVSFTDCDLRETDFRSARMEAVLFERCDLTGADFNGARLERSEMRGCVLDGLRGVDRLRGVAMPIGDILAAAPLFATALGVRVLDD
jgi:uncharacterized protein YjbI with pentapeptide repeats